MKNVNWRTTLFGAIAALGLYLAKQPNTTLAFIGTVASMAGTFLLGGFAKDAATK